MRLRNADARAPPPALRMPPNVLTKAGTFGGILASPNTKIYIFPASKNLLSQKAQPIPIFTYGVISKSRFDNVFGPVIQLTPA